MERRKEETSVYRGSRFKGSAWCPYYAQTLIRTSASMISSGILGVSQLQRERHPPYHFSTPDAAPSRDYLDLFRRRRQLLRHMRDHVHVQSKCGCSHSLRSFHQHLGQIRSNCLLDDPFVFPIEQRVQPFVGLDHAWHHCTDSDGLSFDLLPGPHQFFGRLSSHLIDIHRRHSSLDLLHSLHELSRQLGDDFADV